jgi:hypothetical protein
VSKKQLDCHCSKEELPVKKSLAACGLIMSAMTAVAAHAQTGGVSGDVGTTGIGFHVSVPLRPQLAARVGMGYLDYSHGGSTGSLDYDMGLKARTYDALLDWYPIEHNRFRLTAGVVYNGNQVDLQARPNAADNYTFQGNSYSAAMVGKVTGKVSFGKVAPYLGIGWGKSAGNDRGWSVSTDLGVMLQGSPKTSLSSSGCNAGAAACSRFASDLAQENVALSSDMSRYKVYPVLRIGFSYQF